MSDRPGSRVSRRGLLAGGLSLIGLSAAGCATGGSARGAAPGSPAHAAEAPVGTAGTAAPADPAGVEREHADSGRREVALTFHGAGELTLVRRVLTAFHDRGAAVTVLAVGTWLARYPDAAGLVTGLGHELGNHTWSHVDIDSLDEATARAEIERCRDRIAEATGGPGAFFRPSQARHATPLVRRSAAAAGYPVTLSYDVDSRDVTDPGAAAIRARLATAGPGSVVSMHLGHPGTLAAVPGILDDLAARGLTACTTGPTGPTSAPVAGAPASAPPSTVANPLPGMPTVTDPHNVYAAAGRGALSDVARMARPLVYVPHTRSGDVWVIDPDTFAVVGRYRLDGELQHVVPSWDMRTLYATDDTTNKITPFDPRTGRPGPNIAVQDPYNMYSTPDGRSAISVAEERRKLVFYDPRTWREQATIPTPQCAGIDHADFTPNGRTAVFTCEFAGRVAVVDIAARRLVRTVDMPVRHTRMGPQDIKLAPDGSVFYIADSQQGGLWVLDGAATRVLREIPTGAGAHGLYLSRDATGLYVTNRNAGSVSVLDAYTGAPRTTWQIPGPASPDMGNLTADGTQLWLSGRYHREIYVISTADGHLIRRIPVGDGPHGLAVWPQPGRYSLGHTGITR